MSDGLKSDENKTAFDFLWEAVADLLYAVASRHIMSTQENLDIVEKMRAAKNAKR